MSLYPHPFSAPYWRDAARELRNPRKLTFAALMIAMCVILGRIPSVPLFGGAKITWGFLARALCALVCGPVLGVVFGFTEEGTEFPLTVPEGSIFVMGDNRNRSSDSRDSRLGTVDARYVIGKAVFMAFPGADEVTGKKDLKRIGVIA